MHCDSRGRFVHRAEHLEDPTMPVWPITEDPNAEPTVLTDWALFELPSGVRHIAGCVPYPREGRVTSAVVEFDVRTLRVVTDSGRVYQLRRQGYGLNLDAEYVWNVWRGRHGVTEVRNLTRDVIAEHDALAR
jgi:hypothetical protein